MITREALMVLENNLTFTKGVNRQYDSQFARAGAKIGDTLNVRKPPKYKGRIGAPMQIEDSVETSVPVVLNKQFGVDLAFSSTELTLSIDDFRDRFIKPAVARIANEIDFDGLAQYKNVYNSVGTPGTVPNAFLTYLQAGQKLDEGATPYDDARSMIVNPRMQVTIVDQLKGLFQSSTEISQQYRRGRMGISAGFDWAMDQNINVHTYGTYGGVPLTNGATLSGATTLITDGWTASTPTLNVGDIFTVATVNSVNPMSGQVNPGTLQQFRVTAVTTTDAGGNMTISFAPPMISSGANRTVSSMPADGAAITVSGASGTLSPQGLAYHRDAFTLAMADLELPGGTDMAARVSDRQLGMSIRMVRQYTIATDQFPARLDVLYGWATLRPEMACRIAS